MATKIEYDDTGTPNNCGWWVNEYDGDKVVDSVGPFDTEEEAKEAAQSWLK